MSGLMEVLLRILNFGVGYVPQAKFGPFSMVPWESDEETRSRSHYLWRFPPDGKPFMGDPRQILRQQLERAKTWLRIFCRINWSFLFPVDENGKPTVDPHDTAGYFDYSSDRAGAIRRDEWCRDANGVDVKRFTTKFLRTTRNRFQIQRCRYPSRSSAHSKNSSSCCGTRFWLHVTFMQNQS